MPIGRERTTTGAENVSRALRALMANVLTIWEPGGELDGERWERFGV
jgi:hypothetical protein